MLEAARDGTGRQTVDADGGCALAADGASAAADVELAATVARLLLANGQTTEGVSLAVAHLASAFGRPLEVLARWGELTVQSLDPPCARRVAVLPVAVDIRRVAATERVVDDLCASNLPRAAAAARLEAVGRLPPVSLPRFAVMAAAGAAGLGVIFGAADPVTVFLVALSAGFGALLRRAVSHLCGNPFAQPFTAALLAGAFAAAALLLRLPVNVGLLSVCPCMVLVPGPHFLNGSVDLARARVPLGAARVAFALLVVVAISIGLLAGLRVATPHLPPAGAGLPVPIVLDVAAAGVAVAAYGSFFNMPWRLLPAPIAIGMLAHALRWHVLDAGAGAPSGAFTACALVGFATTLLARITRVPFGAAAFAAVVSLIPGLYMFQAASAAMDLIAQGPHVESGTLVALLENAATTLVVLLAMTAGLIAPKMALDALLGSRDGNPRKAR